MTPQSFQSTVAPAVEGWFQPVDVRMFFAVDRAQRDAGTSGDILEIGTFAGRSAILLGGLLQPGERLVVNDLWEDLDHDPDQWHCFDRPAAQTTFEDNFRRFHSTLPRIVAGSSTTALEGEPPSSFRFVHVDGSHEHEIVTVDVATAIRLSQPDGLIVFDDHMNVRHPGVAAAVWGAVDRGDLVPVALTTNKLYATIGERSVPLDMLEAAAHQFGLRTTRREVCGRPTLRAETPPRRGASLVPPALKPAARSVRHALRRRR